MLSPSNLNVSLGSASGIKINCFPLEQSLSVYYFPASSGQIIFNASVITKYTLLLEAQSMFSVHCLHCLMIIIIS